jgi:hypothetical protein
MYVIPPEQNGDFVAAMEAVLRTYHLPLNQDVPVICMYEQPVQLIGETKVPIPARSGRPNLFDYEYRRNGTTNIFMFTEPLSGWREARVSTTKTKQDWAREVADLLERCYPTAERVTLICDNLNTHTLGALYETFPPDRASSLSARLNLQHTPKHGSWLNIAECELSVFTRHCLSRRIPSEFQLRREAEAWSIHRNDQQRGVNWQFTEKGARIKLKRLYPQIQT